ncbi:MAG: glycogen/starch/alpha-glucan phosphorylase [Leptospiraceae bacterium]|nr:glycogen/starch/alpha-glucan phosphorylase [Leptospiraceae bacterium]MDW7975916.1 glycogen/starch/alpha-glucan phosphorylase [Leptospiraceae bacterium]
MLSIESKLATLLREKTKIDKESFTKHLVHHLEYTVGKYVYNTHEKDIFLALAYTIRDYLIDRWNEISEIYKKQKAKKVYYLSMEFLMGKMLKANLINLGLYDLAKEISRELGFDLEKIFEEEPDAGLGNGGLGRLAACFLDSLASLDYPATGCGLLYEYGIFEQKIYQGNQVEHPDHWLEIPSPWLIQRREYIYPIGFYGRVEEYVDFHGVKRRKWIPDQQVYAQAYDMLIPGFQTNTVVNLRLWKAEASKEFDFNFFSHGDYVKAVQEKIFSENITQVLYPNDNNLQGRELRLKQEYFLVSATIHNALVEVFYEYGEETLDHSKIPERIFFQLNDTHPAIGIAEFIRILVDDHKLDFKYAWDLAKQCFGYTNHTVMPEALEKWDVDLLRYLLPRHLEIIYEMNHYFLQELRQKGVSEDIIRNVSFVEETLPKKIRMANLAIVGSKITNGVSEIHTDILKKKVFKDFYQLFPEKFQNKTNGITFRRWLFSANEELVKLIQEAIGTDWMKDFTLLRKLENYLDDNQFLKKFKDIKYQKKLQLTKYIYNTLGIKIDPQSIFDIHVKRIHEYKRQHLNLMRIINDYFYLKENPDAAYYPKVFIFSGKAAPGYYRAKLIIKLIHAVADKVNHDRDIGDKMKVVFLPNYGVSLAELIIPAADISEQISTAGTEASGTGNMKFMLNGALTIATLDGANIEMLEELGHDNIYIFGKTIQELDELRPKYNPVEIYKKDEVIKKILDSIFYNVFNPSRPGEFQELFHALTYGGDVYFLLADFHDYWKTHRTIENDFQNEKEWTRKMVINTSRSGRFSSDRTIELYAKEIWGLKPIQN